VEILKKFPNLAITVGRTEITRMLMEVAVEAMKTVTDITLTLATRMITIITVNVGVVVENDTTKTNMHFKTTSKRDVIKLY
jgi:hypothetical protein